MFSGEQDYTKILEAELLRRQGRNPAYSLRAFARDLKISPANLSELLKKKHGLSLELAHALAERLSFTSDETDYFCSLVESQHARTPAARELAQSRVKRYLDDFREFKQVKHDAFRMISEWYHLALLDLFHLADYRSDPEWMARRLGVARGEVEEALARLQRLGLLQETRGVWEKTHGNVTVPGGTASAAVKQFHSQILARGGDALHSQALSERDFGAMVVPVKRTAVKSARQRMKDFRRDFDQEFKCTDQGDEVYVLAMQFFRLTEVPETPGQPAPGAPGSETTTPV